MTIERLPKPASTVEGLLDAYGMTLDNWEADPALMAELMNLCLDLEYCLDDEHGYKTK